MASNRVIGRNNELPWHLPADLKHFKELTTGKPIIMGRNTYESIGRPLPNRTNIIVTGNPDYKIEGCEIKHSLEDAIDCARSEGSEIMIIGGAHIYRDALLIADRIYLTQIHQNIEGDIYFPEIDGQQWQETACENFPAQDNDPAFSFLTMERVSQGAPGGNKSLGAVS